MKSFKNVHSDLKSIANQEKEEPKVADRKKVYNNINTDSNSYRRNNKKYNKHLKTKRKKQCI